MGADFSSEIRSSTNANRFRWVNDRMNECWFALYARRRVGAVAKVGSRSRGTKPVVKLVKVLLRVLNLVDLPGYPCGYLGVTAVPLLQL
jgi:hypothetical protein